jgi:hypothetical protein
MPVNAAGPGFTNSRMTSLKHALTNGGVGPEAATCTFAKTGSFTTVHNSVAIPEFPWLNTPGNTFAASSTRRSRAQNSARWPAFTLLQHSITGARPRPSKLSCPTKQSPRSKSRKPLQHWRIFQPLTIKSSLQRTQSEKKRNLFFSAAPVLLTFKFLPFHKKFQYPKFKATPDQVLKLRTSELGIYFDFGTLNLEFVLRTKPTLVYSVVKKISSSRVIVAGSLPEKSIGG